MIIVCKSGSVVATYADDDPEVMVEGTVRYIPDGYDLPVEETEEGLRVTGDFTMHGETHPVVMEVEFLGAGPHPMMKGAMVAGFSATTRIDRTQWGLKWNKVVEAGGALLGDEVEIRLDIEAFAKGGGAE